MYIYIYTICIYIVLMDMNGFCKPAYYNCGHHLVQMASIFEAQKHHIYMVDYGGHS